MAVFLKQFLIFGIYAIIVVHADISLKLADISVCEDYCHKSLIVQDAGSCARGCRFYVISNFLPHVDDPKEMCRNSCMEAYSMSMMSLPRLASCNTGCGHQDWLTRNINNGNVSHRNGEVVKPIMPSMPVNAPAQEDKSETLEDPQQEGMLPFNFSTPVMQVRRVVAQVIGSFHILKTSVLTYFLQEDNTLLAVQSQPSIIVDVAPERGFSSPEEVLKPAEDEAESKEDSHGRGNVIAINGINGIAFSNQGEAVELEGMDADGVSRVALSSHRYTYLLQLLLLFSAVSLSLLALSYCVIMYNQQKNKKKMSMTHTNIQQEVRKLVKLEELTKLSLMEEDDGHGQQAPPLPHKQMVTLKHAEV